MPSTLKFCGRVSELEILKTRWALAANVKDPIPQVVVIKSEPGLGKTRLASSSIAGSGRLTAG